MIKKRVKHVVDEEKLLKFLVLNSWLSWNSSKNLLNKYLKHSQLTEKFLDGLQSIDSKELEPTELEEEEKWEALFSRLIKDLLSKNLKSELDIELYIQFKFETIIIYSVLVR